MKRQLIGLILGIISVGLVVMLVLTAYQVGIAAGNGGEASGGMLQALRTSQSRDWLPKRVMDRLDREYFMELDDEAKQQLTYGAVHGMLLQLAQEPFNDQFSNFYDPELYKELEAQTTGEYAGVGILMGITTDGMYPEIVTVFENTPAAESGLMEDDIITGIDGEDTFGMILPQVATRIKGAPETMVTLTLYRPTSGEFIDQEITRREVAYNSVSDYEILPGDVGFIRITTFGGETAGEFKAAMEQFEADGIKGLIIDLRSNSGGILDSAIEIADCFIEEGLIVEVNLRNSDNEQAHADPRTKKYDLPLVVLVNDNSASASEVLAGALVDHGKAVLVGERSFGKGVVQAVTPLESDESGKPIDAVAITIGEYYTLNHRDGNKIHGNGLTPQVWYDMLNQLDDDAELQAIEQRLSDLADEMRIVRAELNQRIKAYDGVKERGLAVIGQVMRGEEVETVLPLEPEEEEHAPLIAGTDFNIPDSEEEE